MTQAQKSDSQWLPIKSEPKDIGVEALVYSPTQGIYVAVLIGVFLSGKAFWTPKFPHFSGNPIIGQGCTPDITHWMPLPLPPED